MDTQQVRIEKSIGELSLVDLDPQLSQALSAYQHIDPPGPAHGFAPFQAALPAGGSGLAQQGQHAGGGSAAAGGQGETAQQGQAQRQAGPEAASSGAAAQQGEPQPSLRSPADAAEAKQRWDAFSAQTSQCLLSAPSPFDSPAPAGGGGASGQQGRREPPQQQAQAQQQQQQQQQQEPAPPAELVGSAGSYGSYQLAQQPSALPLVISPQQQQGSGSSSSRGFLGLFRRTPSPDKRGSGAQAASAGSDLLQASAGRVRGCVERGSMWCI